MNVVFDNLDKHIDALITMQKNAACFNVALLKKERKEKYDLTFLAHPAYAVPGLLYKHNLNPFSH